LFTIAPGRAFRIKDGKATTPVRANVISGQLFETLLNIEAIANDFDLEHSALGGCGKMNQMPLPVSDGGPTILVKDMQVS
jgi:TldD protein